MNTTPHAAAVRAALRIRRGIADNGGTQLIGQTNISGLIESEYAALVEAAQMLCDSETEHELGTRAIALRAELARVKGEI